MKFRTKFFQSLAPRLGANSFVYSLLIFSMTAASGADFSIFLWDKDELLDDDDYLFYKKGDEFFKIDASDRFRSSIFSINDTVLALYRSPSVDQLNEESLPIVKLSFPRIQGRFLIILKRSGNDKVGSIILDDSYENFPLGYFWFVNMTAESIGLDFNSVKAEIPSYGNRIISPGKATPGDLPLEIYQIQNGRVKMPVSTVWSFDPENREIVFIANDGKRGFRLRLRLLRDFLPSQLNAQ